MRRTIFLTLCLLSTLVLSAQSVQELKKKSVKLPNGWQLTPIGKSLPLGDLPLNLVISPTKKYMAVTNNGQSVQSVQLIDVKSQKILHSQLIPKSWFGLCFSADEKFLYASGGNDNWILKYAIVSNKLVLKDSIKLGKKWPEKISPAGIALDDKRNLLYVVTKENNSLYIIDLLTNLQKSNCQLAQKVSPACFPVIKRNSIFLFGVETRSLC